MKQMLNVAKIKNGIVIDHIPAGEALFILQLCLQKKERKTFYVGSFLPSKAIKEKDILKVKNWSPSLLLLKVIGIMAPESTLNFICEYQVEKKIKSVVPKEIEGIFSCLNENCITNHEALLSKFLVGICKGKITLSCSYCSRSFVYSEGKLECF